MKQYCTPESLYDAGQHGKPYHGVCDKSLETHWQNGHERFTLMRERGDAREALTTRQKEIDDDHSVLGDLSKGYHTLTGQSQTATEQERIDRIDDKIYKNQKLAPPGAQMDPYANSRDLSNALSSLKAVGAGFVGIGIGFGAGHAIMGTYLDSGWKFTVLDAATIAGLIVVSHNCPGTTETATGQTVVSTNKGCGLAFATAALSFLGIRIWEGISAANSAPVDRYRLSVLPVGDGVGLGAVARW